jgi:hypothetical protein
LAEGIVRSEKADMKICASIQYCTGSGVNVHQAREKLSAVVVATGNGGDSGCVQYVAALGECCGVEGEEAQCFPMIE